MTLVERACDGPGEAPTNLPGGAAVDRQRPPVSSGQLRGPPGDVRLARPGGASSCEVMALYAGPNVPYDLGPMRTPGLALLSLTLGSMLAAGGHAADAAPAAQAKAAGKPGTVCGAKVLPLAVGNVWTYSAVAAPTPALPDVARISPPTPKTFTITVKSIEPKGTDTLVTLEEKITYDLTKDAKKPIHDDRVIHSTIVCNAKKFDISPDSFFFAGEPGGYLGMTFDKLDRAKGTSWQLAGGVFGSAEFPEDIVAHWTRTAAEGSGAKYGGGKLELERRSTPSDAESIITKAGSYKAEKLVIKTTGRITLDAPVSTGLKPAELPADWVNQLWFADGYGVVQSLNRYAHMYQLVDSQLK